jgi:hypothetical protein
VGRLLRRFGSRASDGSPVGPRRRLTGAADVMGSSDPEWSLGSVVLMPRS